MLWWSRPKTWWARLGDCLDPPLSTSPSLTWMTILQSFHRVSDPSLTQYSFFLCSVFSLVHTEVGQLWHPVQIHAAAGPNIKDSSETPWSCWIVCIPTLWLITSTYTHTHHVSQCQDEYYYGNESSKDVKKCYITNGMASQPTYLIRTHLFFVSDTRTWKLTDTEAHNESLCFLYKTRFIQEHLIHTPTRIFFHTDK